MASASGSSAVAASSPTTPPDADTIRTLIGAKFGVWDNISALLTQAKPPVNPTVLDTVFTPGVEDHPAAAYFNYVFTTLEEELEARKEANAHQRKENNHLATEVARLHKIIADQQQLKAAVGPMAPTPVPSHQPRQTQKDPLPFKGDKSNVLTRQEEYQSWKLGLKLCWLNDTQFFTSETKKISHAISLLDGQARQERLKDISNFVENPACFVSADTFLAKLDKLYISVDIEREASLKFDKLNMGAKDPFPTFFSTLSHLASICEKSNREIVNAMKRKVNSQLKALIIGDANPCASDDVDGWQKKFTVWSQNCRDAEFYNNNNYKNDARPTAPAAGGDPMDLDAMKQKPKPKSKYDPNTTCTRCGRRGHSFSDCRATWTFDGRQLQKSNNDQPAQQGQFVQHGQVVQYRGNNRPVSPSNRSNQPKYRGGFNNGGNHNGSWQQQGGWSNNYTPPHQLNQVQGWVEPDEVASEASFNTSAPTPSTTYIDKKGPGKA